MAMLNGFDKARPNTLDASDRALLERRESVLGPAYRLFYEDPVHFVRGEGVWLFDAKGKRYLDAYNNVASLGHCHPRVVEVLHREARTLNTHTRYLSQGIVDCASNLLSTLPDQIDRIMFTCTGSEANDLALRIAQHYTGGTGIIVTQLAYHGVTAAVAACSPSLGVAVAPAAHVRTIRPPDEYFGKRDDVAEDFLSDIQAAIHSMHESGIKPAALLVDSLFTSDGIYPGRGGEMRKGVEYAQSQGILLIADEVQSGFARTGEQMWGFARHGVRPDLVTMGKPMGNGHPIAAMAAKAELLDAFGRDTRYFNTFGGNTVSCAVANEVLGVIKDQDLQSNAFEIGRYFKNRLDQCADKFECIGDVRGAGLFLGVELVADRRTQAPAAALTTKVVNRMRRNGVLISASGHRGNVLKIRPPLVLQQDHVDFFIERLEEALRP